MKKKQITPKLFQGISVATPKHDDMLILFGESTKNLNELLIKQVINTEFENQIELRAYKTVICGEETTVQAFKVAEKDVHYTSCGCPHQGDYNHEHKPKKFYGKIELKDEETNSISGIAKKTETKYNLLKWIPEKPVLNNGYYIGSIDLYLQIEVWASYDFYYKDKLEIKKYGSTDKKIIEIIVEFKPNIKSYSETLRQVKVYEKYLRGAKSVVVTYSDISQFKPIFESQGIELIKIESNDEKS